MQGFSNYLVSNYFVLKSKGHFYQLWVQNLYDFIGKNLGFDVEIEDIG